MMRSQPDLAARGLFILILSWNSDFPTFCVEQKLPVNN